MSSKRMTANPIKAPRHRPGKVVAEEPSSSEDEDSQDEEVPSSDSKQPASAPPKATTSGGITSNLSKVDLNERRKLAAANEAARIEHEKALKAQEEEGFVTEEESEEGDSEEGSEEDESEDESSEEEAPRRVLMRPTFIRKDKRNNGADSAKAAKTEDQLIAEEEERRKAAADELVEEQIRKDIAAKAAGKKNWDDEEGDEDEIDDTDDLDPDAEYAEWKLRELKRLKRDREAIEEREKEREEIERRKGLTEEERKREDDEFLAGQKEEKEGKGKMGFMQKYYHKGAFFQDDAKAEGLDRRDIMGSRFADDVNRELLPQALQMRDMTKLGKKGATKYKDLKSEDTGRWGSFDDRPRKGDVGRMMGDDRFMSDRDRERAGASSGANSTPVRDRRTVPSAPDGPKAMREGGQNSRDTGDHYQGSTNDRSRRDSRSPRGDRYRDDDDRSRRKRSTSRGGDRYESDKRRRIDSS